ncbi:hypothetical protein ACLM5H_01935 [Fredinandcohnia humi]
MRESEYLPKSIRKAYRYIKQEAPKKQLLEIKKLIDYAIKRRESILDKSTR